MKKILFTICLMTTGLYAAAQAQVSVTPRASFTMPQGFFSNIAGNGFGYGLDLYYAVNDNLRIGASFSQQQFDAEIAGFSLDVIDFKVTPITASIKYVLPGNTLRPYIGLQGGIYNFSAGAAGFDITREYWGLAPSLGVLYPINDKLDFFASAQYHMMYLNENIPIADFNINQDLRFIPVNIGLSFKF